jgi:hypothetical protein
MTLNRPGQYVTGMCIAGLSVCAGGWLVVTAFISAGFTSAGAISAGHPGGTWNHAAVALLATGAGLALVAAVTFACWAMAWRHVLRADGVLIGEARRRSRRQARRQARQLARESAREARLEAAGARREARLARREARAMDKRERAQAAQRQGSQVNVALDTPVRDDSLSIFPAPRAAADGELGAGNGAGNGAGFGTGPAPAPAPGHAPGSEPDAVRPPNADRVLAQLRDLLGPLLTALDADAGPPAAGPPGARRQDPRPGLVSVGADAEEAW